MLDRALLRAARRGQALRARQRRLETASATPKGVDDGDRFTKHSWGLWAEGKGE
jgi:hypothetical protein